MEKEQPKMIDVSSIIDKIIATTLTRHARLSEEAFLKELGIKEPKTEEIEVRNCKFALINAITKEILLANDKIKLIDQTFKLVFGLNAENKGE